MLLQFNLHSYAVLSRPDGVTVIGKFKELEGSVIHKTGGRMDCVITIIGESIDTNKEHTYLVIVKTETLQQTEAGVEKVLRQAE